jgi:glyoxylase-like metal-dependent hydrolase (beta-lactamase superfamily II)
VLRQRALVSGDTLFIGGCGRFFEGTPQQMNAALNEILAKLDPRTVSCHVSSIKIIFLLRISELFRHELNCAISLVSSIFLIFSQNLFFTI